MCESDSTLIPTVSSFARPDLARGPSEHLSHHWPSADRRFRLVRLAPCGTAAAYRHAKNGEQLQPIPTILKNILWIAELNLSAAVSHIQGSLLQEPNRSTFPRQRHVVASCEVVSNVSTAKAP